MRSRTSWTSGDDVVAVVLDDACPAGARRRGVEDGPVLGDVDVLAGEHGVPQVFDAGGPGQRGEEREGLRG